MPWNRIAHLLEVGCRIATKTGSIFLYGLLTIALAMTLGMLFFVYHAIGALAEPMSLGSIARTMLYVFNAIILGAGTLLLGLPAKKIWAAKKLTRTAEIAVQTIRAAATPATEEKQ